MQPITPPLYVQCHSLADQPQWALATGEVHGDIHKINLAQASACTGVLAMLAVMADHVGYTGTTDAVPPSAIALETLELFWEFTAEKVYTPPESIHEP